MPRRLGVKSTQVEDRIESGKSRNLQSNADENRPGCVELCSSDNTSKVAASGTNRVDTKPEHPEPGTNERKPGRARLLENSKLSAVTKSSGRRAEPVQAALLTSKVGSA